MPTLPNLGFCSPCIQDAQYKTTPQDFRVDEIIDFPFTNEGEHLLLHIEKTGANTAYIAKQLARWAGISNKHVGYCGLKDRHAITRQWFSLWLPKRQMPTAPFTHDEATVLQSTWHQKKLPTGAHAANRFHITLREVSPTTSWEAVDSALQRIAEMGVPNYFGAQRFGHNQQNIPQAREWFAGEIKVKRHEQSILLSAARSIIFNAVLKQRVQDGTWNTPCPGDVMNLDGSNSIFDFDSTNGDAIKDIQSRCASGDIHPTGVMWGSGKLRSQHAVAELEQGIARQFPILCAGLEQHDVRMARRSLRLLVQNLQWQLEPEKQLMTLSFTLGKGSFATSVLDALGAMHTPSADQ